MSKRNYLGGLLGADVKRTSTVVGDANWDDVVLLMDGSSSTADQSSASNNPDSVVGTVNVTSMTGPYGTTQDVLDFTSAADKRILFPIVDDLRPQNYADGVSWTLETWFKTSDTGTIQRIFGIGNNLGNWAGTAGGELELSIAANDRLTLQVLGGSITATTIVTDNNWHHVAVVYDGTTLKVYVDGTSEGTTLTVNIYGNTSGTAQIRLGDGYLPSQQGWYDFVGYMADFRITKGVARYTSNFTPPTEAFLQAASFTGVFQDPGSVARQTPNVGMLTLDQAGIEETSGRDLTQSAWGSIRGRDAVVGPAGYEALSSEGILSLSQSLQALYGLSPYSVRRKEPEVALDFTSNAYRTAGATTTFADAFTGTSPKLTYSTAAGSNSTMVNSSGEIVWAPHNLVDYSEDFSNAAWVASNTPVLTHQQVDPDGGGTATKIELDVNDGLYQFMGSLTGDYTFSFWVKGDSSGVISVGDASSAAFDVNVNVTTEWTLVSTGSQTISGFFSPYIYRASGDLATVYVAFAHVYRSDLGGMAPVPGAATGFATYVPTNGNAEYLPRVGHHVYNGSAWVNEGLLIESELRTNLIQHSDFSGGTITPAGIKSGGFVPNSASGLDGATSATVLIEDSSTGVHRLNVGGFSITSGVVYTASVYVKPNGRNEVRLIENATTGAYASFNVETGAIVSSGSGGSGLIENAGGGWYRCAMTFTSAGTGGRIDVTIQSSGSISYTGDDTSGLYLYGLQLDQGQVVNGTPVDAPTPSSYMPTSGGTYTRTAQSLTVPPAEFGWPEPEFIGPELVTNGDFGTGDLSGWTDASFGTGTAVYNSGGADLTRVDVSNEGQIRQAITTTAGRIYEVSYDRTSGTSGRVWVGTGTSGTDRLNIGEFPTTGASNSFTFVATGSTTYLLFNVGANGVTVRFDNISVREINPLSVSIQMDGRITYADTNVAGEFAPYRWQAPDGTRIAPFLDTNRGSGGIRFLQISGGIADFVQDGGSVYSPGINVPFNISSRHGSTFINGATDGTALTANTTPTALPDLSGTNLQIAYDFMGTIGTFRQFAGDIGDAGLEEATS